MNTGMKSGMKFHVLTLFPEMILNGLHTSIIGRAAEKNIISIHAVNIRDYTLDRHGKVDDYPYGGGAGMLMQAQPVYDAHRAVTEGRRVRTVYVTPQGTPFTQRLAEELAHEKELIFLCGHYEGIDERVLEEVVTDFVSIGDYVLTGGELPAMVMIDAIARLVPGVLNNGLSAETESFHNDLLEYPQYSRPEVWHEKSVPGVLLSGDHKKIAAWRLEESKKRTEQNRPDLYEKYLAKERLLKRLAKDKRNYIHMMESLCRGRGEILSDCEEGLLLYDRSCKLCMLSAENERAGERLLELIPREARLFISSRDFLNDLLVKHLSCEIYHQCIQVCYPQKQLLPVAYKEIRPLFREHTEYVLAHYHTGGPDYIEERISCGAMFGAFSGERLLGFAGVHDDGSMGMLFVEEENRGRGIGEALEAYCINRLCERGFTPYAHIIVGNEASLRLQKRLGLYEASKPIWWLGRE